MYGERRSHRRCAALSRSVRVDCRVSHYFRKILFKRKDLLNLKLHGSVKNNGRCNNVGLISLSIGALLMFFNQFLQGVFQQLSSAPPLFRMSRGLHGHLELLKWSKNLRHLDEWLGIQVNRNLLLEI